MSTHSELILYVAILVITVGGIAVFYDITQDAKDATVQLQRGETAQRQEDLRLVSSVGYNILNDTYQYMRFQVEYDGNDRIALNDTYIQLRTDTSTADLKYRNGTTTRSLNNGFFTQ